MLARGTILSGTYRIDGVLGEGGMAVVYAATHLRNTARRAVKVLHADSGLKGHIRARFVREGKVANSVHHPGAVHMIDDGVTHDGYPYLVMERLEGECVVDIPSCALPLSAALSIAYQVLDVLRAAHDNGIIHRDIKPANLFLLRDGRVKVLDFGISRLHDGAEPFDSVANASVMGTPFFMAPEQARAEASEIDTRTDLFGVGATLFALISGQYLYTGEQSREVIFQAANLPARSLDSVAPGLPRGVVELVAKAVAFDSAARWQSAQGMQDALREVHEALFGPITFATLASLVLVREFRRKSYAKLVGSERLGRSAANHFGSSALSTTLPALADLTRSRESQRGAPESPRERERSSSPISAGPPELAGWTGQVPGKGEQKAAANRSRVPLSKRRLVQLGLLAGGLCAATFGFGQQQREPTAAASAPLIGATIAPLASVPIAVSIVKNLGMAAVVPPAQAPSARRASKAPRPPNSAIAALPPSTPAKQDVPAAARPWAASPTLIPALKLSSP
jgi:serine/threonine protein kinase